VTWLAQVYAEIYDSFGPDYERTRVPRFRPFAKKLLQLYDTRPKSSVLDAGTGSGLAATLVAPRVGHEGRVVGLDVSEAQLEIARKKAKNFGFTQCVFVLGDSSELDFKDGEFDLVVCSFALGADPAHTFSEYRRVLKAGTGVLLAQEWAAASAAAEAAFDGLLKASRVATPGEKLARWRAAWDEDQANRDRLANPKDYTMLLSEAGFRQAQADVEVAPQHFESAMQYVEWRELAPTLREELETMEPETRARFRQEAEDVLKPYETGKGFDLEWNAIQVVARA
jgi:O-methyltransferase / aklanonic acid methyltransferase